MKLATTCLWLEAFWVSWPGAPGASASLNSKRRGNDVYGAPEMPGGWRFRHGPVCNGCRFSLTHSLARAGIEMISRDGFRLQKELTGTPKVGMCAVGLAQARRKLMGTNSGPFSWDGR